MPRCAPPTAQTIITMDIRVGFTGYLKMLKFSEYISCRAKYRSYLCQVQADYKRGWQVREKLTPAAQPLSLYHVWTTAEAQSLL
jgi:hypothetical protein